MIKERVNYSEYLKSEYWRKRRAKFISKTWKRCFICRATKSLQVHHKRYYRNGKSILFNERHTDLRLICKSCHTFIHENGYVQTLSANRIKRLELLKIIKDNEISKESSF